MAAPVSPKLTVAGVVGLTTALVVTYLVSVVPGVKEVSQPLSDLLTSVLSLFVGLVAGYARTAVSWASEYVRAHGGNAPPTAGSAPDTWQ